VTGVSAITSSQLSVLLDIRQPLAYLALRPSAAFASELGIEINWLPLTTPPLRRPSNPAPQDDRGIRHRRSRAEAIVREIETYSAIQGIVLREYYRDGDAGAVNQGWLFVRERHPERLVAFLSEAFRAYWALEWEPSDEAAVAALIDSLCQDGAEFLTWSAHEGPATAASLADELRGRGLTGSPCYVIEDEVFLGRQHLPMIQWILQGRNGSVPI